MMLFHSQMIWRPLRRDGPSFARFHSILWLTRNQSHMICLFLINFSS